MRKEKNAIKNKHQTKRFFLLVFSEEKKVQFLKKLGKQTLTAKERRKYEGKSVKINANHKEQVEIEGNSKYSLYIHNRYCNGMEFSNREKWLS